MRKYREAIGLIVCLLAFVDFVAACGGNSPNATPTHVTAEWVDAFNHADYRAACATVAPATRNAWARQRNEPAMQACEESFVGMTANALMFGMPIGGYAVVPHSYKGWREGKTEVASVEVTYLPTGGQTLKARLVKTAHGWKIVGLS